MASELTKDLAISIAFTKRSEAVKERNRFPHIKASVIPVVGNMGGRRMYVVVAADKINQRAWFKAQHEIWAVNLTAQLAQEQGLQAGNLWEPPISRAILADVLNDEYRDRDAIEEKWRFQLDLPKQSYN